MGLARRSATPTTGLVPRISAVAPESQRQGLGSGLITPGLVRARAAHCPAFLETSLESNVTFYESHGFQIVDGEARLEAGP